MSFTIKKEFNSSRIGILKTKHGNIETPFFMPVATKAAAKFITGEELKDISAKAIISNSFMLYLKPGIDLLSKIGVHKFMNYNGAIFTDCGGFQKLRSVFLKVDNYGIHFKSPFDGGKHLITPKAIVDVQYKLGSDVAMSLDDCSPYNSTREETISAMKRTHLWAKESLEEFVRLKEEENNMDMLLFGIFQGGFFPDLREESVKYINELNVKGKKFDGIAIGGLRIGEPIKETINMLKVSMKFIDKTRPHYLMGVGNPADIIRAVRLGVDIFDSVYPVETARHGNLFTSKGKVNIKKAIYKSDLSPLDEECGCFVCKHYTKAYLHHLFKTKEPLAQMLAVYHNQYFMQRFMNRVKEAIREESLDKLENEIVKKYETP